MRPKNGQLRQPPALNEAASADGLLGYQMYFILNKVCAGQWVS